MRCWTGGGIVIEGQICGVGPTDELSLRVSVATLARVIFPNPEDGRPMLALEHKATLFANDGGPRLVVKAQPFGGAVRILDYTQLGTLVKGFHFDSERSRSEGDFRIYIRPADWRAVREFCLRNFGREDGSDLESSPARELVEEFHETIGVELHADKYTLKPAGTVLENEPLPTDNVYASGVPTVRIYRVFEVKIVDPSLFQAMMDNSEAYPSNILRDLVLEDAQKGGRGRANAIYVAPMEQIRQTYLAVPPERRGAPLPFADTLLDGNVAAVLEGVLVAKYRYLPG